ncbi:polyamine aminopropyltransferase [Thermoanaerobacterium sp. RBIITD]|uniref:polyamine aminopropyltransferase n=1 Tax=Thermoanaerobacterium sp. RBIITD TaxID=1550240 RepID=UPI000BB79888|nr:polyamine aminopropyltransferase [Thermoanaerobacterium sp. RBIITD]SNX55408.1 spermidine synthase [Thermoanaerobacterium sp. RBIITD]
MELWFTEHHNEYINYSLKIKKTLNTEKTDYQELAIIDTEYYGKTLVLDGILQTTENDEFVYHEMIVHVPLFTHKNPKSVLIVGGGDGGAIKEILKHKTVERIVLAEIDERVVENSKKYLPSISYGLDDEKVEIMIGDGIKYVEEHKNEFDVVIVDSTDPIGPAVGLFTIDFYKSVYECLKEDGIIVAQTESPFIYGKLINKLSKMFKEIYPIVKPYICTIPTYPGSLWTFTMGSKKYDPEAIDVNMIPKINTKYYTPEIHKSCFVLPKFIKDIFEEA